MIAAPGDGRVGRALDFIDAELPELSRPDTAAAARILRSLKSILSEPPPPATTGEREPDQSFDGVRVEVNARRGRHVSDASWQAFSGMARAFAEGINSSLTSERNDSPPASREDGTQREQCKVNSATGEMPSAPLASADREQPQEGPAKNPMPQPAPGGDSTLSAGSAGPQGRDAVTSQPSESGGQTTPDDERIYSCRECGVMRSKSEGGNVFTVCDECWDKLHPKEPPEPTPEDLAAQRESWVQGEKEISEAERREGRHTMSTPEPTGDAEPSDEELERLACADRGDGTAAGDRGIYSAGYRAGYSAALAEAERRYSEHSVQGRIEKLAERVYAREEALARKAQADERQAFIDDAAKLLVASGRMNINPSEAYEAAESLWEERERRRG